MNDKYSISLRTTWEYILRDLSRYRVTEKRRAPAIIVMCPGLIASVYYRIGHWMWYSKGKYGLLLYLLRPSYIVFKRLIEVYSGISLSTRARIGGGLYINHFGSIFVGEAVIGENCNLSHEVTLGIAGRGEKRGTPVLGDRVYVAAGAKIIGPVQIGNDVAVGANAVVTTSMPECAVAVGIPAHVISYEGSFEFVLYEGMEDDPARMQNLMGRERTRESDSIQQANHTRRAI